MTETPHAAPPEPAVHPPADEPPADASAARGALWRRRLFEGEAGLTRFVVETRAGAHMRALLEVKQAIFESLPDNNDEQEWKAAFFRGQALMERFVVHHFGLPELAAWARSNGIIYAAVDPAAKHDARVPLDRLAAQADLYGSDTEWLAHDPERATLRIRRCAIWEYRERARRRGVPITLGAPCEYCVPATTAMVTIKGLNARHQLTEDARGHGCVWTASRTPAAPEAPDAPEATDAPVNGTRNGREG
ncbi:hypothetical protein [Streptomyces triticirhizae]|uniref:hypothetical protein n=1 Tax=Streptomyces triticirhizae TaxID=2483353 RepID=UPI0013158EC5|nr:hypothetical protein [Streptomyces triticirhizae]